MVKMGQVYVTEDKQEEAYMLYMKYLTLFVEKVISIYYFQGMYWNK